MSDMDGLRSQLLEWERAKYRLALSRAHAAAPSDALFASPDDRADQMATRAAHELLPYVIQARAEWARTGDLAADEVVRAQQLRSEHDQADAREAALLQAAKAKAPASALAAFRRAS